MRELTFGLASPCPGYISFAELDELDDRMSRLGTTLNLLQLHENELI